MFCWAYVLLEDRGSVLLFHPKDTPSGCASIEMAHLVDGCYESSCQENDGFGWVNLETMRCVNTLIMNLDAAKTVNKTMSRKKG